MSEELLALVEREVKEALHSVTVAVFRDLAEMADREGPLTGDDLRKLARKLEAARARQEEA